MSALRAALLEWDLARALGVLISGVAVFLASRVTEGFLVEWGATILFAIVLSVPWEVADRLADRSSDP